jgi:hypothetical protein
MKKFLLLIGILALALGLFADVTIGSGTSTQRQPFDALYGFGRSADIYLASEINATGNITHLGWYVGLATSTSIPIKIYLTTTTATSLAQTPWATLTAGLTPVYNATAQFNALGWAQLDITDFAYNHQTSGNLLVLCEANYTGSGAASTDCPEFRYTNDGNTGSMHQYWQQDGEAPTFDGRVTADRPNIKLYGITSPSISSFPWFESFGTEYSHWPVADWTQYEGYYPTTEYESGRLGRGNWLNGPAGNNAAKISIYGSNFASWLITPPINIPATGYELRFDLGLTNYSTTTAAIAGAQPDDRFIVAISNSPDMSNPTILREWNNTGSPYVFDAIPNTGIKTVINLGAYTGIKYIAFYADTSVDNGWNDLFVDNVNVRITPTAPSITLWPTPLYFNGTAINTQSEYRNIGIANTGNGTINLSVADFSLIGADAGHFEYISSALPAAIAADQSINIPVRFVPSSVGEKSAILRIRYAGIDYNMELKGTAVSETALLEGFEGGVIPSNWTVHNVDGGIKLWDAMTLNPRTGTYAARARNEGPGWTNNDWLITPALQVRSTTTDKISFWMRTESASTDNVWQVLISTTDTNPSSFTMIDQGMGIMPEYVQKTYHLDSYGDAVIYLAVRYIGNQAYALLVDDFVGPELYVAPVPPLAATLVSPADGATDITLDTTLNWASGGGQVDGYKLSLWEDLSTHAVEIVTDLDLGMQTSYSPTLGSDKHYGWKVVPYNIAGDAGNCPTWTFTTLYDPTISSFPYFEGFEVEADTLPLNWIATEAAPNAIQHWKAAASAEHGPSAPASGSSFAWLHCYIAQTSYNPYSMVSPPFALDATAKRLSYQYWIGDDTVAEPLFVDISTDLASWTTLYTHSNATNTLAWHYNVISLAPYSSQTVYLRFRGVSNYNNGMTDLGIDSVWIEDIPSYPILTCNPTGINFGDVMQGVQTGPRYVTITNTGGGILNLVATDISILASPGNLVTDFSFGTENLPAALATGESVLIPVYVNATTEGPLYGSLQIVNNQGPQPAYAYVDLSANGLPEGMVAIGDGLSNLQIPINPFYEYSYSQSIFLQSEIAVADKRIEKVYYYWNGAGEATASNDWTVYMGHTALTEFADEDSWIPRANLSQVFQGNVALPATAGWIEITLNAPFPYDNSANLVIAVDENAEDYDGSSMYFLSTNTTTNRSIRFYDDDENPDPAAPPTGDLVAGYPNLKLGFVAPLAEAPGTVTLTWPQEEATNLPRTGFDLSWTPSLYGGTPTHYTLYLNQTQNSDWIYDGLVFENLTGTSFNTVTDGNLSFNYGEYWCWMVVAHNSYGSSEDNITNRFQIGEDPTITIPHTQNFDAATFPYGWTQANIGISSDRWFISESAEAGGEANELVCAWIEAVGISRLISPPINTEGISSFEVSFQQFFYDYAEGCTASLQYSHDLQSWYEVGWSMDSGNGNVTDTVSVVVTPGINQPITYLAWTIIGNHYQFNNWYIDNVSIKLPPVPPIALPFIEDWTHGSFETNIWTADSENWISNQHTGVLGYMLCAAFKPEPRLYNYESILSSHDFDARGIMSVKFSFDLFMTSDNSSVNNTLTWEVWDGWDWYTIDSHNSQDGNVYWERQIADLSNFVSNRIFKIRFVASGSDSNAIRSLHIDNIHLVEWTDTLAPVTDLKLSKHAVNDYSTLHWTAVPGADWYRIYVSEDPYGEFVHLGFAPQAVFVFDNADVPADKAFFRVTAGTGTQPAAAKLSRPPNK